ncbi:MAG: DUF411 domain-containing protein, partial [Candidatus Aenigmarchaeota archaeon]|nr:DUF411 domain-containing protein [Candidatus Aenigmarchaeota archaeon]
MRFFSFFIIFMFLFSFVSFAQPPVVVYKNEACGHCNMYLANFRLFLKEKGITSYEERMVINNPSIREELNRFNKDRSIPITMQGHMVVSMGNLVLEGHVPLDMLEELMKKYPDGNYPKAVIYQDYMLE